MDSIAESLDTAIDAILDAQEEIENIDNQKIAQKLTKQIPELVRILEIMVADCVTIDDS